MAAPIVVFLAAGDNDIAAAVAATSENEQELEGEVRGRNPTNKMARGGRAGGRGNPRPPTDSLGGQAPHSVPPSFPLSRWRRRRFKIAVFAPLWNWGRGARCRSRMEWSGARLGQNVKMLSNPFLRPLSPLLRLLKAVFVLFRKSSIHNHPPPPRIRFNFEWGTAGMEHASKATRVTRYCD